MQIHDFTHDKERNEIRVSYRSDHIEYFVNPDKSHKATPVSTMTQITFKSVDGIITEVSREHFAVEPDDQREAILSNW